LQFLQTLQGFDPVQVSKPAESPKVRSVKFC
jgi:hypothetical protein